MFLSIATTHEPATDLGFLLMKHPARVHETELAFGKALVFYSAATDKRCEAVLCLEIDPVGLVRGRGSGEGLLDQYVNDRPYAASSFLSVALNRVFRTAMTGVSKDRQELAALPIPLEIHVTPLPASSEDFVRSLFAPLGWSVQGERIAGPEAPSRYVALALKGTLRLADALNQLYVLIPVLDDEKHYWVGDDEVDKLLAKGGAWLRTHPEKEIIAQRYLKRRRRLAKIALARLAPEEAEEPDEQKAPRDAAEDALETPISLNDQRMEAVIQALKATGAEAVADLGCGEGKLLSLLVRDKRYARIIGLDASSRALERAADRLQRNISGSERVALLHGALTYRDDRWKDVDAATLVEVIEHLDQERLPAMASVVFGAARPKTVIITTPNAEYNVLFPTLPAGKFRHPDHRFEWTRAEFQTWCTEIARQFGYEVSFHGIGTTSEAHGAPTQMAVLSLVSGRSRGAT